MKRAFIATCCSLLAIALCLVGWPLLVAVYVAEAAWKATKEVAVALWAFARLPWAA